MTSVTQSVSEELLLIATCAFRRAGICSPGGYYFSSFVPDAAISERKASLCSSLPFALPLADHWNGLIPYIRAVRGEKTATDVAHSGPRQMPLAWKTFNTQIISTELPPDDSDPLQFSVPLCYSVFTGTFASSGAFAHCNCDNIWLHSSSSSLQHTARSGRAVYGIFSPA